MFQDLEVQPISDALAGYQIDVIVSGSIGACESVRFVRSLRRLGADAFVTLTEGGRQFITETSLSWASAQPVITGFKGDASHLGTRDAVVIAPASANVLGKVAQGIADSPATALVASYLGQKKPVLAVPNMHNSLFENPFFQDNLRLLRERMHFCEPRQGEGKQKFPAPDVLADEVSHVLRRKDRQRNVLVTMGTTRGYIDDVRYVSNYSSGKLGSLISEEFYRQGFKTHVVCGPCPHRPRTFSHLDLIETNDEMEKRATQTEAHAAVLAASVLDFLPDRRTPGKIRSGEDLTVRFRHADKIIAGVNTKLEVKVGFKLEPELSESEALRLAADYMPRYGLSLMVLNSLQDVDESKHTAYLYERRSGEPVLQGRISGKVEIAQAIVRHVIHQVAS